MTNRYTGYVQYRYGPGTNDVSVEEIDVDAANSAHAQQLILNELTESYQPGGELVQVVQRLPGELYF